MDSSNCFEGIRDSLLSTQVATQVHISERDPPSSRSQTRGNVREAEVGAHPMRCAQTETSYPPPPSNAAALSDTAHSSRGATPSHPLAYGRGQIRGQLVPPAHPSPSDARPVLDHFNPPAGIFHPDLASASLGLAQVSQPLVTQAFASWRSFAGWGRQVI